MKHNKYYKYLRYIFLHKLGVFIAGRKLGVPMMQILLHDWSKLTPTEFLPYVDNFYGPKCSNAEKEKRVVRFRKAWLHHINRNPHHWNYWVYVNQGNLEVLPMPENYMKEMVADWMAVSYAMNRPMTEVKNWYAKNKDDIILHTLTKEKVEDILNKL